MQASVRRAARRGLGRGSYPGVSLAVSLGQPAHDPASLKLHQGSTTVTTPASVCWADRQNARIFFTPFTEVARLFLRAFTEVARFLRGASVSQFCGRSERLAARGGSGCRMYCEALTCHLLPSVPGDPSGVAIRPVHELEPRAEYSKNPTPTTCARMVLRVHHRCAD